MSRNRKRNQSNGAVVESVVSHFLEAIDVGSYVDPNNRFNDDGQQWIPLGAGGTGSYGDFSNFTTEAELTAARNACRYLARYNPYAICGHENRISYLVGNGHTYKPVAKPGKEVPPEWLEQAKAELDKFYDDAHWVGRQKETIRRFDRDGECFRRIFDDGDSIKVRFVEPWQVMQPNDHAGAEHSFGIHTEPEDVEEVLGYWISNGERTEEVPADEIQHLKANVDCNVKRGVPMFWPVRNLLWSCVDTLLNIGKTSKIQTSIAVIRFHQGATKSALETMRGTNAEFTRTNPVTAKTEYAKQNQGGRVLDVSGQTKYEFPSAGIDVNRYGQGVQAMLRAVSSMVVMPEFMFTSDASNANYSSTMIAEGPAVKNFERLQAEFAVYDLEIMNRVLQKSVDAGRLDGAYLEDVTIEVGFPKLVTRDALAETQVDQILAEDGILSPQTRSANAGLEYEQEQENFAAAADVAAKAQKELAPKVGADGIPMDPGNMPKLPAMESMSAEARKAAWGAYVGA